MASRIELKISWFAVKFSTSELYPTCPQPCASPSYSVGYSEPEGSTSVIIQRRGHTKSSNPDISSLSGIKSITEPWHPLTAGFNNSFYLSILPKVPTSNFPKNKNKTWCSLSYQNYSSNPVFPQFEIFLESTHLTQYFFILLKLDLTFLL